MAKNNNFKVYFSSILSSKYHMTKEGINGYWDNKEKQENFENKKLIGTIVGLGELVGAASLCFFDQVTSSSFLIPIVIMGGVGALTTKISFSRENPYYLSKYRRIDNDYQEEKKMYKRINNG